MRAAPTPTDDAIPRTARLGYGLAVLVLLASLLVVVLYWRVAYQREMAAARADFVAGTRGTTELLYQRLGYYELVTRGGVSLFASVARPSRRQWQDYVDGLDLGQRFPALVGLGFAIYASPGQLSELQRLMHDSGDGLFQVRPHGLREHYGAIVYLEPKTSDNLDAIGYDMYAEPVRNAAMDAALDSGQARLSAGVHLVQDHGRPVASMLMFQPVYRAGAHPAGIVARHESMQGWVYIPFRIQMFVDVALRSTPQHARFSIVDVTDARETVLYAPVRMDRDPPAFVHSNLLERYGRRWRMDFESESLPAIEARITGPLSTVLVGLFASLLLFGIALTLVQTQARAEQLAARMSESWRRSEIRFRAAMEYSSIGKGLLDHDGRIVEANPALAVILASTAEALVGTPFDACFIEDTGQIDHDHDRERDLADGVIRTTRTVLRGEDVRRVQLTFAPVPGDVGQDIARLVQVEDVTDRVRAQAQVLALNRTLEARVAMRTRELTLANQALETFAYSVSHDLRAPLRSIDGFSKLLAERCAGAIDETGQGYLARVRNATGRMGELIESLLKMSRVGRGGMNPVALDLGAMANEILDEFRATEPQRNVEIEIAWGLRAIADPGLARSLLLNLLGNAWKFSRDRAVASIQMGRNDAGEFFVRDNGAGFAQEYADKLFRPFQRLHGADEFSGHGIGLASVKRIVERHGGSIRAEGKPGVGATFYFTLPEIGEHEALL